MAEPKCVQCGDTTRRNLDVMSVLGRAGWRCKACRDYVCGVSPLYRVRQSLWLRDRLHDAHAAVMPRSVSPPREG